MDISFNTLNIDFNVPNQHSIRLWIKHMINEHQLIPGQIIYVFTNDKTLLEINQQYLNHDYYTDIITFDDRVGDEINGSIFISIDRIKENAQLHDNFYNELLRVLIHGILHLIGFKDKTKNEKLEMTHQENRSIECYYSDIQ